MSRRGSPATDAGEDRPFSIFVPRPGRIFAVELSALAASVAIGVALMVVMRRVDYSWIPATLVAGVLLVVWIALSRRSRRVTVGDEWVSGPAPGNFGSATVWLRTLDWKRSGLRNGRLTLRSMTGHGIAVRTRWFDPQDIAEIKRLLRERCPGERLPPDFY